MHLVILAHFVAPDSRRRELEDAMYAEAGWGLGRNPANIVEMTGLGSRHITDVYSTGRNDGAPGTHPGQTPFNGTETWTGGSSAKKPLNDNPYVTFDAFDDYSADGSTSSASKFTDKYSAPYYNNRLSVPTVNGNNELIGYEKDPANVDNFVGNGTLMYLENQATQLQEHNFRACV